MLVAGNIRNGVNIFGVVGNFVGWVDTTSPIIQVNSPKIHYSYDYGRDNVRYICLTIYDVLMNISYNGWSKLYINTPNGWAVDSMYTVESCAMLKSGYTGPSEVNRVGNHSSKWIFGLLGLNATMASHSYNRGPDNWDTIFNVPSVITETTTLRTYDISGINTYQTRIPVVIWSTGNRNASARYTRVVRCWCGK